ncbi:hypothetical protein CDL12_20199 [Handroanthus impetiginosus]|uniref:Uncharacterized protein n=1 Tax=Handroanthus impetiginosus TaxID=429701 RepID=A0A2G9GPK3_9LAMI|nr:hypothetical protein CDL12_20199 [Handroanthus impetiginosus]
MIPLRLISSPSASISPKPRYLPSVRPIYARYNKLKKLNQERRRLRDGKCREEFSLDAPVAMAIGACILSSLIFPVKESSEDDEAESLIDSGDARITVMSIISFIPYFNWLSWVFAWLDTGKRRYAVYAIVYLAPYLRSNLSISPEESWLPITSILLCIVHIQLEASIRKGDLHGFEVFNVAAKYFSSITQKKSKNSRSSKEEEGKDLQNLPSAREQYSSETSDLMTPQKPHQDGELLNNDEEGDEGAKH